jgi:hypothetical protein
MMAPQIARLGAAKNAERHVTSPSTEIRPENVPSQGVAVKIGMTLEKRTWFAGFEHLVFSRARAVESNWKSG